jgi:hypothetical protein
MELKTYSAEQLLSLPVAPERAEGAYRRGYCDGFIVAMDLIWELMFMQKRTRQEAYDLAVGFHQHDLTDWLSACKDDCEMVLPPQL